MRFADFLDGQRDAIVRDFVEEVRQQPQTRADPGRGLIADHIPPFLEELAAALRAGTLGKGDTSAEAMAKAHGKQRHAIGYDLEAVVTDYGLLRHCILRKAKQLRVAVDIDDFDALAMMLNRAVAEAAKAFVAERNAELAVEKEAAEYLADAGRALGASLDLRSVLGRLPGLFVPRLADWCVVYLDSFTNVGEFPMAHVDPRQLDALRAFYATVPLGAEAPLSYARVLASGRSERGEAATPPQERPDPALLAPPRRWLIAPLTSHGQTFGAVVLGELRTDGSQSTLPMLAEELAGRAAAAIENARLYELAHQQRFRMEAVVRAKDEFVATISHELRTPLSAILGWTRMLRSGRLAVEKQSHALEVIERNVNAQTQLVSDLLDISRVVTGKVRINPVQIDLSNLVESTVDGLRPAAEAKHLRLATRLAPGMVVRADGDRLQQVIWNLLSNAVKFTPREGRIDVLLEDQGHSAVLTVSDSGAGIAAQFLPHVFEHFRQGDDGGPRNRGGLGLGLSIAKNLVELHGGSISAHSAGPGQGAQFRVELPTHSTFVATEESRQAPPLLADRNDQPPPEELRGLTALLVDDDADSRDLLLEILNDAGLRVSTANDGAEALRQLAQAPVDVLISDLGMPELDGYGLIRAVRLLPLRRAAAVPAIALTAYVRHDDRMRALSEGFNEHLAKPVEPRSLLRVIAEVVGQRNAIPPSPLAIEG